MSVDDQPEPRSENSSAPTETLAESFTQSKRELKFILGTWLFFFSWVGLVCYWLGYLPGETKVPVLFGMPSWVVFGIALPWLLAIGVAVFFATRVMKDTDLRGEPDADPEN